MQGFSQFVLFVGLIFPFFPAWGQAFPTKPVRVIIPYAPGGTSDILARLMQPHLQAGLGQFPADQAGEQAADDARHDGEQDVQRSDVLVVRGEEPADEEAGLVVVIVVSRCLNGNCSRISKCRFGM